MDINAYIESGILELYVMDALSPAESSEVESLSDMHPAIKARIRDIQVAFSNFAEADALSPRPGLKAELMKQIEQIPPVGQPPTPAAPRTPGLSPALAGALVALVLSLLGLLYQQWKHQQANATCQEETAAVQKKLDFLLHQGTIPIALKAQPAFPGALVTIYWNAEQGATLLEVKNLPALKAGQQFQLWSLKDGQPHNAGLLVNGNIGNIQTMLKVTEADAFAITIEQEGGAASPTLANMVVLGKV